MSDNLAYVEWRKEELIDGEIVAMAPAAPGHTYFSDNILVIFKNYLKGKTCIPFGDNLLVHLSEKNKFIPDVMVVCDRSKIKKNYVEGAPDLAVEVLSPSTMRYDRGKKKDAYEAAGVPEYWLVDWQHKSIEVYLLEDGHYRLDNVYILYPPEDLEDMEEKERAAVVTEFKCHLFDDLIIRLEDIFDDSFT